MLKLLKFTMVACNPCKTFNPIVKEVTDNFNMTLESIDAENSPDLVQKYNVKSVPTVILVDDNVELARHTGLLPKTKFSEWLAESKKKKNKK
jgi:thioredoxin-like negative regulator of GroEL